MNKFRSNNCLFFAAQYRFECLYQELPPVVFKANLCALGMQFMTVLLSLDAKIVFWVSYDPQPPGNGMSN